MFKQWIVKIGYVVLVGIVSLSLAQAQETLFQKAVQAYEARDLEAAEKLLQDALAGDPKLKPRIMLYQGLLALHRNQFDIAAEHFMQLDRSQLTPEDMQQLRTALAYLFLYGEGTLERAQQKYQTAIQPWEVPALKPWNFDFNVAEEYVEGIVENRFINLLFEPFREEKWRTNVSFFGERTWSIGARSTLGLHYRFDQLIYERNRSDLDLQSHRVGAQSYYWFDGETALNGYVNYTAYRVGESFNRLLNSTRAGGGYFFREFRRLFGSVSIEVARDNFRNNEQDTVNQTFGLFQILRFKKISDQISAGYSFQNAPAKNGMFGYDQHLLSLGGSIGFFERSVLSANVAWAPARFDGHDLVQRTTRRKDYVSSTVIRYTYRFPIGLSFYAQYYYSHHKSNVARHEYNTRTSSIGMEYQL